MYKNYGYSNGDGTFTVLCGGSSKDKAFPNYMVLSTNQIDSSIGYSFGVDLRKPIGKELREEYQLGYNNF